MLLQICFSHRQAVSQCCTISFTLKCVCLVIENNRFYSVLPYNPTLLHPTRYILQLKKNRHFIHTTSKWVEYSAKESLPCNISKWSWFYALSPVLFYGFCCKRSATMKSIGRHRWPYLISPLLALTGKCCCFSNAFNVDAVIIIGNMMTIVLMEY